MSEMISIQKKLCVYCLFFFVICSGEALSTVNDAVIPELQYMDLSVDPCENFYDYSCGNFKKHHPLGKERVVDEFTVLTDKIIKFMTYTLKNANSTNDSEALNKVKTTFESCLNLRITDSRKPFPEILFLNDVGGMPLFQTPKINPVFGWREIGELTAKYGVPLLFRITVIPFPITTSDNLIRVEQDTFSNPAMTHPQQHYLLELLSSDLEGYLTELDGENKPFGIFLRKVFTLLRNHINIDVTDEEIRKGIEEIVQFMKDIQTFAGIPENKTVTPLTTTTVVGDLQQWTNEEFDDNPPMDWIEYLDAAFGEAGVKMQNTTNIYVNSTYVYNVLNVVKNTRPDIVKNFILMRILLFSAMDSTWQIRRALEDYYRVKNITLYSREEYCVRQLIDIEPSDMVVGLSLATGRIFAENDDGAVKLRKAEIMIKDLSETFARFLSNSDWMDSTSKAASLNKAKMMVALIGLPELTNNNTALDKLYSRLKISKWDNYGNSQRLRAFKQAYMFAQMGQSVRNRGRWDRSPFETNAYYNRANNKITIPFAMMNPVFFGGKLSLMDYSHLGMLVGHEITHGFDNSGRQYDGNGMMNDIWTKETLNAYQQKIQCFKQQYSRYFVEELNRTVDGAASLNENLADNGGIRIAYETSKKFFNSFQLQSKKFTTEQLFFIGFGTTFCSTQTREYLDYSLNKGYAPSKYRIIGALSNMEEFSKAFNCPKGSFMNPEVKCSLW